MTNEEAIEVMKRIRVNPIRRIALNLAIQALEKQIQDKWIPVSEKPEKSGWYLCTLDGEICGNDNPFVGMCLFDRKKGEWDEEGYILAWKPLPEPYRED